MLGRKFRMAVAMAAVTLGIGLGTGTAAAGTAAVAHTGAPTVNQTVVVLSDTITFAGVATPAAAGGGNYVLTSNNCTVVSDGENPVFPCTINLTLNLATLTGTGHITGPDGVINWSYKLAPAGGGQYTVTGNCATSPACYEIDSDGGASVMYPIAAVTGSITITPIAGTPNLNVSGKVSIWEDPNQP